MPYLTTRKKPKATTKPWFSRLLRHPARKWSGSILGHNTHPRPTLSLKYVHAFRRQVRIYLKSAHLTICGLAVTESFHL